MSTDLRAALITAALFAAVGLMVLAILEMDSATDRIEESVAKADLAAGQAWQVIAEAREITRRAAEGPGQP